MREIDKLFEKYGESHQNKFNKIIHWIFVPLIVLSLLGLCWSIPFPEIIPGFPYINVATFVVIFAFIYYIRLSIPLAIVMLFLIGGGVYLIELVYQSEYPLWLVSLGVFVVSWVFQFVGHEIEGKKPSFIDDLKFLLIGPIWLLHFVFKKLGLKY